MKFLVIINLLFIFSSSLFANDCIEQVLQVYRQNEESGKSDKTLEDVLAPHHAELGRLAQKYQKESKRQDELTEYGRVGGAVAGFYAGGQWGSAAGGFVGGAICSAIGGKSCKEAEREYENMRKMYEQCVELASSVKNEFDRHIQAMKDIKIKYAVESKEWLLIDIEKKIAEMSKRYVEGVQKAEMRFNEALKSFRSGFNTYLKNELHQINEIKEQAEYVQKVESLYLIYQKTDEGKYFSNEVRASAMNRVASWRVAETIEELKVKRNAIENW